MKKIWPIPRLRYFADFRTLGFVLTEIFLLSGTWSGLWRHPFAIVASGIFAFICCIVAHNHMHLPVFRGLFWNKIFQLVLMFGSGQPPTGIITAHNERHHIHPDSPKDFVRTSLVQSRWNVINIIAFPFVSIATMFREKPNDLAIWKKARPRLYQQALLERSIFYSMLFLLMILDWYSTLLFLILPWLIAQLTLVGVNLLQHQECDMTSEYDHSRNVTGRWLNWFLLNNGFHTAHHLRPALHWSLLPKFHREHIVSRMDPRLNHQTFAGLLLERLIRSPRSHAR